MSDASFLKRIIVPVIVPVIWMAVSFAAYEMAPKVGNHTLHQTIAGVSGVIFFICVWLGVLFVYTLAYSRKASVIERIVACLIIPFLYATKEVLRITVSYTILESIYFYLSPLALGVFFVAISEMGLSEIIMRSTRKKQGETIQVFPLPAVASFLVGLSMVVFIFAWGKGENTFYVFLQGFRILFGPGIGV